MRPPSTASRCGLLGANGRPNACRMPRAALDKSLRLLTLLALASGGLTLAAAPAASAGARACASTKATPATVGTEQLATSTLCLLNAQRARYGVRPLRMSSHALRRRRSAMPRTWSAATTSRTSPATARTSSSGSAAPATSGARAAGIVGENLAWGAGPNRSSPRGIVAAWMNSPPHRAQHPQRALPRGGHRRGRRRPAPQRVRHARRHLRQQLRHARLTFRAPVAPDTQSTHERSPARSRFPPRPSQNSPRPPRSPLRTCPTRARRPWSRRRTAPAPGAVAADQPEPGAPDAPQPDPKGPETPSGSSRSAGCAPTSRRRVPGRGSPHPSRGRPPADPAPPPRPRPWTSGHAPVSSASSGSTPPIVRPPSKRSNTRGSM